MKIYNPERADYNKERRNRATCYFCDPKVIAEQECTQFNLIHWMVLVNKYPYMDGNVMLVPREHVERTSELTQDQWAEFLVALNDVQSALSELFGVDSFNIGINIGEESGASVAHLHWQIIPRHRKNHNVVGVLADIQTITVSPQELKKKLSS